MVTANLLQACDDVRAAYQERFRHILVDEFQDTNHAQNEIVKLLGEAHGNVCVVGDSDQSVYRWRGADIRNILEFERAFPNVTTIMLEQNFRSTQTILDAANAVIANNIGRQPKELFTVGDAGGPIKRYRAEDERDEASWVSSEILRLHASEGLTWGDVAVFYRTNAQSLPLETSMKFSGIPYKVVGGAKFYDRREIKDILAYVRVLANPDDEVSARRIVERPQARHRRHLGGPSGRLGPDRARRRSPRRSTGRPTPASRARRSRGPSSCPRRWPSCGPWCRRSTRPTSCSWWPTAPATWPSWWPSTRHEADGRIENLAELATQAADFDDVMGFLETVALVADSDELDSDGTRVSLMTLHTAKGLEYPAVFVVGPGGGDLPALPVALASRASSRRSAASSTWASPGPDATSPSRTPGRARTWGRTQPAMPEPLRDRGALAPGRGRRPGLTPPGHGLRHPVGRASTCRAPPSPRPCRWPPAAGREQGGGPRGSTGAEDLGLGAGDEVVHDHWGRGVVVSAKGEGSGPRPPSLRHGGQEEPAALGDAAAAGLSGLPRGPGPPGGPGRLAEPTRNLGRGPDGLRSGVCAGASVSWTRMKRPYRVVVAKPGLDGHDRGAKVIARALRDSGFEVVYTGLHQTPEQVVQAVVQEDADAVGLSLLSGAHLTLVPKVVKLLADAGRGDVLVIVGGIIPEADIPVLKEEGVAQVFTPGRAARLHRVLAGRRARRAGGGPRGLTRPVAASADRTRPGPAPAPTTAVGSGPGRRRSPSDPRH